MTTEAPSFPVAGDLSRVVDEAIADVFGSSWMQIFSSSKSDDRLRSSQGDDEHVDYDWDENEKEQPVAPPRAVSPVLVDEPPSDVVGPMAVQPAPAPLRGRDRDPSPSSSRGRSVYGRDYDRRDRDRGWSDRDRGRWNGRDSRPSARNGRRGRSRSRSPSPLPRRSSFAHDRSSLPHDNDHFVFFGRSDDRNGVFSTHSPHPVAIGYRTFPTVEHYICWEKLVFAGKSYKEADDVTLRTRDVRAVRFATQRVVDTVRDFESRFNEKRNEATLRALQTKADQHDDVYDALMRTGNRVIVFVCDGNRFHGVDASAGRGDLLSRPFNGQNFLGIMWMLSRVNLSSPAYREERRRRGSRG